jgi:hypothetical protein
VIHTITHTHLPPHPQRTTHAQHTSHTQQVLYCERCGRCGKCVHLLMCWWVDFRCVGGGEWWVSVVFRTEHIILAPHTRTLTHSNTRPWLRASNAWPQTTHRVPQEAKLLLQSPLVKSTLLFFRQPEKLVTTA